jgi:hypothetical protein
MLQGGIELSVVNVTCFDGYILFGSISADFVQKSVHQAHASARL